MAYPEKIIHANKARDLRGLIPLKEYSKVFVLTDSNTLANCWPLLVEADINFNHNVEILEAPPGESSKCIEVAAQLWSSLIELGADRNSVGINLGGGVITDLGGFIASTFKRGISFYNLPTSLLAQVDASIGGKNGINLGDLKNQVGTFSLPVSTIICPDFLDSLPQDELRNGFAEVIKHALITGSDFWQELTTIDELKVEAIKNLIPKATSIKEEIVNADPLEKDERKKLNFGHTVGHALESVSLQAESPLSHGEAVAVGMLIESFISKFVCDLSDEDCKSIETLLLKHFPDALQRTFAKDEIWQKMQHDKKNQNGKVNCTLLYSIGHSVTDQYLEKEVFEKSWAKFEAFQKWISE